MNNLLAIWWSALFVSMLANCTHTEAPKTTIVESVTRVCSLETSVIVNQQFGKSLDECTRGIPSAESTSSCLMAKHPKFSVACADCFGYLVQCSSDSCLTSCMFNRYGKSCRACVHENCVDPLPEKNASFSLANCTGIAGNRLRM